RRHHQSGSDAPVPPVDRLPDPAVRRGCGHRPPALGQLVSQATRPAPLSTAKFNDIQLNVRAFPVPSKLSVPDLRRRNSSLTPCFRPVHRRRSDETGRNRTVIRFQAIARRTALQPAGLLAAAILAAGGLTAISASPAAAATLATGDPRSVSQPAIPATCST